MFEAEECSRKMKHIFRERDWVEKPSTRRRIATKGIYGLSMDSSTPQHDKKQQASRAVEPRIYQRTQRNSVKSSFSANNGLVMPSLCPPVDAQAEGYSVANFADDKGQ